ncbi:MAG TPA: nuclear transport factor 2 family protein [Pseudolabrys sp.]
MVEAFYRVHAERDAETVLEFLDDDAECTIRGPVDVLPFGGTPHGKAAVLNLIGRLVPEVFRVYSFVPDAMLEGDRVATLNRLSARNSDRVWVRPAGRCGD